MRRYVLTGLNAERPDIAAQEGQAVQPFLDVGFIAGYVIGKGASGPGAQRLRPVSAKTAALSRCDRGGARCRPLR